MKEFLNSSKQMIIAGNRGTGKTEYLKHLLAQERKHIVIDPNNEYQGYNRYVVEEPFILEKMQKEVDDLITLISREGKIKFIAIDEANRVAPSLKNPPKTIAMLIDLQRHKGVKTVYITRRPVQLNANIHELNDFYILFSLKGKNDIQFFNDIANGLGDAVAELDPDSFEYILVQPNRTWKKMPPIKI